MRRYVTRCLPSFPWRLLIHEAPFYSALGTACGLVVTPGSQWFKRQVSSQTTGQTSSQGGFVWKGLKDLHGTNRVREANGNSFEASGVDAAVRSRCSGWNSGEMTGTGWRWSRWWSLMMTKLPLDSESPGRFHLTQIFIYIYISVYIYDYLCMYWTHCIFVKICTMVSHVFSRHWEPFCPMEDGKMPSLLQGSASEQKPPLSSLRKGRTWGACTLTRSQIFEELSKIQKTPNAITFWAGFHLPMISDWMVFSHQSSWLP